MMGFGLQAYVSASIRDRHLFQTWRLLEHGHQNAQRLSEAGIYLRPGI